jgi:hypothetical protein
VPELLVQLMAQDRPTEMQLASARCLTYMHRAGAMNAEDPKILYRTLPCLVSNIVTENPNITNFNIRPNTKLLILY